ncbi:MAG TPA: 50S ribosomal protein L21 [Thermoanaerobaculia bacterium]|nr:50S ribosomal protein L21 [Thermoanaerobaculia bacterium]
MFAVIETGGKQYRVKQGDVIEVELEARGGAVGDGSQIEFERVLMVGGDESVQIGQPTLQGAKVTASLLHELRGRKIKVFKKKRRKGYKRLRGHRQDLLRVRIGAISV